MKLVHGIGQPPVQERFTTFYPFLCDAGIPFARLHDVGGMFGGNIFVDIPNVFRDFDADVDDPDSYDFAYTDILINALIENGVEPVYRLGVTIEQTEVRVYRVYPPKDFLKWARICEHIIMHYTEGWANGFHHKIRYWEIWNEPDNAPDGEDTIIHNHMWQGKREEFYRLYTVASKHLKARFPHLMIGGYGSCGFYTLHNGQVSGRDISNSSPRYEYFITFFEEFLEYIKNEGAPLDFFTWHNYRGYRGVSVYASYVRETLDKFGYTHTETHCNEWSVNMQIGTQADCAVRTFLEILAYQNSAVDAAMAYDGRINGVDYAMLFNPETQRPRHSYFCFKSFNRLYRLKNQVEISTSDQDLAVIAASDGKRGGIIVINATDSAKELKFDKEIRLDRAYITDQGLFDFETERLPGVIMGKSFITILCELD